MLHVTALIQLATSVWHTDIEQASISGSSLANRTIINSIFYTL